MKKVIISIHPKWCELIFNGSKSIEVRKSRPSIDMPFRVYVYQTKLKVIKGDSFMVVDALNENLGCGKVIGSFVCDRIVDIKSSGDDCGNYWHEWDDECGIEDMCLSYEELEMYLGKQVGYGWHITEPKLFDKPRKLGEFSRFGYKYSGGCCINYDCPNCIDNGWMQPPECKIDGCFLTRPPQSWVYCETIDER